MSNSGNRSSGLMINISFLLLALAVTVASVATGAYIRDGYLVNVGEVSLQRVKAPITVENKIVTERNRQAAREAAERLDPITTRDENALDEINASLEAFFKLAEDLRREQVEIFTPYTATSAEPSQDTDAVEGTEALEGEQIQPEPALRLPGLSESATKTLLEMDTERYDAFMTDVYVASERMLENGVQEIDAKTLLAVRDELDKLDLNSDARNLGYDIITLYLRPNIIVDEEATELARAERAGKFERVFYLKDQTIVNDGDIVTEEMFAALNELGLIKTDYRENLAPILGAAMLVVIILIAIAFYMYYGDKVINARETMLVFTLYTIVVLAARALVDMPMQLLPITIFTILMATFLGARTAAVFNLGITIICFIIVRGDVEFLIYYSLSGTAVALITSFTTDRGRIFISALLISIVNLSLYISIALLVQRYYSTDLLIEAAFAAMAGLLSVIISFGSMPFWEGAFGLVTPIKLLDLTNPNNKLLRRLAIEAPGTYHHSVIVANLAETAAYDIGANLSVARSGGYYHDIGKLKYPHYFAENMVGANPHDEMDPFGSVQVILSHVSYGLELAVQDKLPKVIQDIIAQHHGTTLVKYFYYKVKAENPSTEVDENEFRYPHIIPQSKEAAVVMLADTVEAAVRSMIPTGKSMDEVSAFITELVRDKLDDGQLQDSTLTIRDLDTVVKSFMRVFRGMYHERIPYPHSEKVVEKVTEKVAEVIDED